MIEELKKDEAMPLPDQIYRILRTGIESGEFPPGKRLGSIRQFARAFEVSPGTVIKALDILEEETLIERIPVKGIFVSNRIQLEKKPLNACFAFPEKEMDAQKIGNENWGLNYELYRGLFAGSQQYKINLQFIYFEDQPAPSLLERQQAALQKFDLVIFPGDNQLIDLREASAMQRLTFFIAANPRSPSLPSVAVQVDYDFVGAIEALTEYFQQTGCQRAAVLADSVLPSTRPEIFRNQIVNAGFAASQVEIRKVAEGPRLPDMLKKFLREKPEFVFVDFTEIIPDVFEAAFDLGMIPGKDFIITAISSGMTFRGLVPRFSYFRVPRFEMGCEIMKSADEIIRSGRKNRTIPKFKVEFIQNEKYNHSKRKAAV
ncbi:MAG: GntR family transcriptional regulator [Lentisphaeria bacterium]|nr:GntR family transcriptional regulator [Lentisphaeria bacterium]